MRKSTRIVKKTLALFLVVLMSIESFGAVVSDNDGSAFITKAEFDSLKNDFQSQIDQYNTSIDSKINGAIASYLAGINVARQSSIDSLCYDADGIYSAYITSDFDWKEGDMSINIEHQYTSYSTDRYTAFSGQSYLVFPFTTGTTASNFKNLVIRDKYNTESARWDGLYDAKEYLNGKSIQLNDVGNQYAEYMNMYYFSGTGSGWERARGNQTIWTNGGNLLTFGWSRTTDPYYRSATLYIKKTALIARQVFSGGKYKNIILTPTSKTGRFNDGDEVSDFQYDNVAESGVNAHSYMTEIANHYGTDYTDSFWASNNLKAYYITGGSMRGTANSSTPIKQLGIGYSGSTDISTFENYRFWKPFFGFSPISDFNKLYLTKYDSLLDDLVLCHGADNIPRLKDKEGKFHLGIVAGAPILKHKKETIIDFDVTFQDANDHHIWFRKGPWTISNSPQNDPACSEIYANVTCKIDGSNAVWNDVSKAWTIPANKTAKITIKNEDADYFLFMKWSLTNNGFNGGGTFLPPQEILVTSN